MFRLIAIFGCALGLGALCGCGAAGPARDALIAPPDGAAGLRAPAAADFALEVLPESFIGGGRATLSVDIHPLIAGSGAAPVAALSGADGAVRQSHSGAGLRARHPDAGVTPARPAAEPSGGESALRVDIYAEDASGLRALYCDLHYDPARWQPVSAEPAPAFGAPDKLLTLAVLDELGAAHYGQVLIHPLAQPGFNGSGVLASLRFAPRRGDAFTTSSGAVSGAGRWAVPGTGFGGTEAAATGGRECGRALHPLRTPSAAETPFPLVWWNADEIKWPYVLRGDTDQNGEVGIADLTPIGMHFGETVLYDFGWYNPLYGYSKTHAADADGDGSVTISDLTPIGAGFGMTAASTFEVYGSLDPADYPADAHAPNGPGAFLASVAQLNEWKNRQPLDIRDDLERTGHYYLAKVDSMAGQAIFWVRSGSDGNAPRSLSVRLDPIAYQPNPDAWTPAQLVFKPGYPPSLDWWYWNSGDCNQDGIVYFDDLQFIGMNFGQTYPDYSTAAYLADVDLNDEINVADSYPIGAHLGWQVAGYRIYATDNSEDYSNPGAAGVQLVATIPFESALGDPLVDRLRFQYNLLPWPGEMPKQYVWVCPYCCGSGASEGAPSSLLNLGVPALSYSLNSPSEWYSGTGTVADPYEVDPTHPSILSIVGSLGVDVSASVQTQYTATVPLDFLSDPNTNIFWVQEAFSGDFSVSASYKGIPTVPPELYFRVLPAS